MVKEHMITDFSFDLTHFSVPDAYFAIEITSLQKQIL